MIVATKLDLEKERQVSTHEGASFANELGFPFLETSAKDNDGVQAAFNSLTDRILAVIDASGEGSLGVQVVQPTKKIMPEKVGAAEESRCLCA